MGCESADPIGTTCPVLGPGAAPGLAWSATLDLGVSTAGEALEAGHLTAFTLWLPAGADLDVEATVDGTSTSLFLYGPRDRHGGVPSCLGQGQADHGTARAGVVQATGGEYLLVVGPRPGAAGGEPQITATCSAGCPVDLAPCPTLAEQGCPDLRCDGELALDDRGCATCNCETGRRCEPGRSDGPWGSCIRPACDCALAQPVEVCGADGATWPSACDARCAGVPVLANAPCATACPALAECEAPCWGLRAVEPTTGCPTCDCAPSWPASVADCAACPLDEEPVCGADGVTYRNRCVARCAGVKLLYSAACVSGCRGLPDGCDLDCPWGLRLGDECVLCDCADGPPPDCLDTGVSVCSQLDGLAAPTTVGSACLAGSLGATEAITGPCGMACPDDRCPIGSVCPTEGEYADRCVMLGPLPCDCGAIVEFVCGVDNITYPNSCHLRCMGVAEAHRGPCCAPAAAASCEGDTAPSVTAGGCPNPDGGCVPVRPACHEEPDAAPEACSVYGDRYTSACAAHGVAVQASPAWCAP